MEKDKLTKRITWIAISFATALTAILLVVQVLRIFFGNDGVFTKDIVIKYLLQILFSLIIWVLVVIAGGILSFKYKITDNKNAKHGKKYILNNLLRMINLSDVDDNEPDYIELKKEEKKRKIGWLITIIILAVCLLFVCLYIFNSKNYSNSDANKVIVSLVGHISPFVVIGFVASILMVLYEAYSANKSIIFAKKLLVKYRKKEVSFKEETIKQRNIMLAIKGSILLLAIVLIIVGAVNGGAKSLFFKAANICSECIGLG